MKSIVVVGGGYGATRYVESLLWNADYKLYIGGTGYCGKSQKLSKLFGLKYIPFEELKGLTSIDCIILAIPPSIRRHYVNLLINMFSYQGIVISEKPLFINESEAGFYDGITDRFATVCQRDFFKNEYLIDKQQSIYNVSFPSFFSDEMDNIVHVMPHVLSWFASQNQAISEIWKDGNNHFCGKCGHKAISIFFHKRNNSKEQVQINDVAYANVNYRLCNDKIVQDIFAFDASDFRLNISRAIEVSYQISNLLMQSKKNEKEYFFT